MRLVDWQYASLQKRNHVIEPYEGALVRELPTGKAIAYGQERDGYVLRLSETCFIASYAVTVDPKHPPKPTDARGLHFVPSQSCLMALTMEHVQIPRGYRGHLELVTEYAICGLHLVRQEILGGVQSGPVVVSLVNPLLVPVWLHHGEGVARLVLEEAPYLSREEELMGDARGAAMALPGGESAGA